MKVWKITIGDIKSNWDSFNIINDNFYPAMSRIDKYIKSFDKGDEIFIKSIEFLFETDDDF